MEKKDFNSLVEEVLNILEGSEEKLSITQISKEVGYSKYNSNVYDAVVHLVEIGKVKSDDTKNYSTFYVSSSKDEDDEDAVSITTDELRDNAAPDFPVDEMGYKVKIKSKGENPVQITSPNGSVYDLEIGETLVVIGSKNDPDGSPFGITSDTAGVFALINQYTERYEIGCFRIQDVRTGEYITDKKGIVYTTPLIFLNIEKQNKAA